MYVLLKKSKTTSMLARLLRETLLEITNRITNEKVLLKEIDIRQWRGWGGSPGRA